MTVDPHLVPDVWLYAECLEASFVEFLQAANRADITPRSPSGSPARMLPGEAREKETVAG